MGDDIYASGQGHENGSDDVNRVIDAEREFDQACEEQQECDVKKNRKHGQPNGQLPLP